MGDNGEISRLRAFVKALVSITDDEYRELTQWVNPFAQVAREIGDSELAGNLSKSGSRGEAVLAIERRLYQLNLLGFDPDQGPAPEISGHRHTIQELVEEAIRRNPGLLSGRARWSRLDLIREIQKFEGYSACIGNFSNCGHVRRTCLWAKDCAELAELPELGEEVVDIKSFEKKRGQDFGRPGLMVTLAERKSEGRSDWGGDLAGGAKKAKQVFIEFPRLESLLNFVDVALSRRLSPGVRKEIRVRRITGEKEGWGLIWPDLLMSAVEQVLPVFEGRVVGALPSGETVDLNTCLERIPLKPRSHMPTDLLCLFVLVKSDSAEDLGERTRQIYQSFPRALQVQCRFLPGSFVEGHRSQRLRESNCMLILFSDLSGSRAVYDWVMRLPEYATAFYPLSRGRDNKFFCQWGFIHPVVAVARLYDAGEASYVLLRASRGGERGWLIITREEVDAALRTSPQVFSLEYDPELARPVVIAADKTFEPYGVVFRAKEARQLGVAELKSIARKVDRCRRTLTSLERKYEGIQQRVGGQCRAALVFFEPVSENPSLSQDGHVLPKKFPLRLRQFLSRPTTSLTNFRYFFNPSPRPDVPARHVLISETPVDLADILLSCADEIYLQDPRWQGWGVNLFCEQSLELEPRLDDPQIAQKVLECLTGPGDGEPIECWLITSFKGVDRGAGRGDGRLLALGVPRSRLCPLPEAFRMMNVQGVKLLPDFAESNSREIAQSVDSQCANLVRELGGFYEAIVGQIEPELRSALEKWGRVYKKITLLRREMQKSKDAVDSAEALIAKLAPTWEKFISSLMEFHLDLCRKREGLFERLEGEYDEFVGRKKEVERTLERVERRIVEIQQEIGHATDELERKKKELDRTRKELQGIHGKVSGECVTVERELQKLDRTLEEDTKKIAKLLEALDLYLRQEQETVAALDDMRESLVKLAMEKQSLTVERSQLEARVREMTEEKNRWEAQVTALREEVRRLKESIVSEDALARNTQLSVRGLQEQVHHLNQYLKQLRKEAKQVVPQAEKFVGTVESLVEILQTRPNWLRAAKAGWLFAQALVLVPYGFYPSEFPKGSPPRQRLAVGNLLRDGRVKPASGNTSPGAPHYSISESVRGSEVSESGGGSSPSAENASSDHDGGRAS